MDNSGAFTGRMLAEAGIVPGMRVLDVGCGQGDVSLRLAAIIGQEGRVVGVDRDTVTLERARKRAEVEGVADVEFVEGDLDAATLPAGPFDAVIGRRVLMYLPDPARTLRALRGVARPGAVVAFQEHDSALVEGGTLPPLHARVQAMVWATIAHEGGNVHMGHALASALRAAGFEIVGVRVEAIMLTPELSPPIGQLAAVMLPRMIEAGVTSADELDPDTLDDRLALERAGSGATLPWETIFGVWARTA